MDWLRSEDLKEEKKRIHPDNQYSRSRGSSIHPRFGVSGDIHGRQAGSPMHPTPKKAAPPFVIFERWAPRTPARSPFENNDPARCSLVTDSQPASMLRILYAQPTPSLLRRRVPPLHHHELLPAPSPARQPEESRLVSPSRWNKSPRSYRFVVAGYVVMPEHVHLLLSEPLPSPVTLASHAGGQTRIRTPHLAPAESKAPPILDKPNPRGSRFLHRSTFGNTASATLWYSRKRIAWRRCAMHRNPVKRGLSGIFPSMAMEQLLRLRGRPPWPCHGKRTTDGKCASGKPSDTKTVAKVQVSQIQINRNQVPEGRPNLAQRFSAG